ncbi:hypothetical protein [Janthinobacterium sp. PC23-8]|nr:hypothetical protein [Janthinobacterium sp. PC23-8]
MKKTLTVLTSCTLLAACGGGGSSAAPGNGTGTAPLPVYTGK